MPEILLNGRAVSYAVRHSPRARRASIRIGAAGVEVVLPLPIPQARAVELLRAHTDWVLRMVDGVARKAEQRPYLPPGTLLYLGRPYRAERAPLGTHWTLVPITAPGEQAGEAQHIPHDGPHAVPKWLCDRMVERLNERVAARGREMNLAPRRIGVRNQRRRWGSCSGHGALSFNWRLIMAPPEVLDYVVVHELAHLAHPNHSRAFWDLVRRHYPDAARERRWLKEHGWLMERDVP
jgi:predicted metal-dependent hydrolase